MIVREYKKVREGGVKPSLAFIFLGKWMIMMWENPQSNTCGGREGESEKKGGAFRGGKNPSSSQHLVPCSTYN